MPKNPLQLKIAYLYPDILKGFCDAANVETFQKRAFWRDIDVKIDEISSNDKIKASKYDFYYIGGSNIRALESAIKYLKRFQDEIKIASLSGVPMLAINCGYALFGNSCQLNNKNPLNGIEIFDIITKPAKTFCYGNVEGTASFLKTKNKTIAGFENHEISAYLNEDAEPFLILKQGIGNNGENKNKTEGSRFNNSIGSFITSPILAQNPHLCDYLISRALKVKYRCSIPLAKVCDDIEWFCHNYLISRK